MSDTRAAGRGEPPHGRREFVPEVGPVLGVRELARLYIIVGINGDEVVVRSKSGGRVGSFRFRHRPLAFFRFRPLPGA